MIQEEESIIDFGFFGGQGSLAHAWKWPIYSIIDLCFDGILVINIHQLKFLKLPPWLSPQRPPYSWSITMARDGSLPLVINRTPSSWTATIPKYIGITPRMTDEPWSCPLQPSSLKIIWMLKQLQRHKNYSSVAAQKIANSDPPPPNRFQPTPNRKNPGESPHNEPTKSCWFPENPSGCLPPLDPAPAERLRRPRNADGCKYRETAPRHLEGWIGVEDLEIPSNNST